VTLPRHAVEGIVSLDGVHGSEVMDFDTAPLCLPDVSLVGLLQPAELKVFGGFEWDLVSPKLIALNGIAQGFRAASQFQIVPPALPAQVSEDLNQGIQVGRFCG